MSVLPKSFLILSFRSRPLPVFPSILIPKSLPRNRQTRTLSSVSASTFQSPPPSVSPETPIPIPPLSDSLRWSLVPLIVVICLIKMWTRTKTSGSGYSPLNNSSRLPLVFLYGCDSEHWLIILEFPERPKPLKEEMIDTYVKTLASIVGSEEEAKKRIYSVCTTRYTGFRAIFSKDLVEELRGNFISHLLGFRVYMVFPFSSVIGRRNGFSETIGFQKEKIINIGNYRSNGFLKVSCNGGLNQMRAAVCVFPLAHLFLVLLFNIISVTWYRCSTFKSHFELDKTSFWADPSDFGDIFDVNHFIDSLIDEVRIIKRLPKKFNRKYGFQAFQMSPVSWSNEKYYLEQFQESGRNDTEMYAYPWWREKEIMSEERRQQGLCPLTPEEATLVLQALDFDKETQIYIASGEICGSERRLASLRDAFPHIVRF
ncbi:hypothetical protein CXB51_027561 [Gossypium anomalum]|uniref:O-fucosyltransferase family protein n=1 Tax=Gossypium anomalum TaxID=47600 RepID=A0A8J6CPH5_9ROSI|nr:hypothetical protein CXB51_027561 [Gossypium anomalum]